MDVDGFVKSSHDFIFLNEMSQVIGLVEELRVMKIKSHFCKMGDKSS